ncbi:16S rRNA (guanine(527)-N(7))-methyltransferase RsmG [Paracoccus sp. M683]|uniref:16S rRNA (guanine(527)-N(7))-methyltransferase RsmG n=1 Tax=Paracoccus sp. M683 TaxID=2594268 RepID=UPI00117D3FAF|nr:16S rRNA (guanine(527)-N(7))-methyltransferase RsmG [Paracoccus sp. M683]TRW98784.1 16S rRNA (guanine(527)-N(7))-methyltransferase RsmG [Paracoccus sp. M683]
MTAVSRETSERIAAYEDLILKWNGSINLVGRFSLDDIRERHITDSQQLADLADLGADSWTDLGSGGGLPGLVAAIQAADLPITFHLVESDQRKATFLRTCARTLDLPHVKVHSARIESLIPLNSDIVSARALAPLPLLMSYVHRHLKPDGTAWLMKGENWQQEVRQAQQTWQFHYHPHPSRTNEDSAILEITGLTHV